jgi:hypothetical protein
LGGRIGAGFYTIVNRSLENVAAQYDWHACNGRAISNGTPTIYLHRVVYKAAHPDYDGELHIDHINGLPLDNRLENLRPATASENTQNSRKTDQPKTSRFKGVYLSKRKGTWYAAIRKKNEKRLFLGSYDDEAKAALVYDDAAIRLFGAFSRCNFPGRAHAIMDSRSAVETSYKSQATLL